jgi:hypothetical protein
VGRDDAKGERNGVTDAIAMEEMIGKDGYVAYVNGRWWERERERERKQGSGRKGKPNFKKQLQAGNRCS